MIRTLELRSSVLDERASLRSSALLEPYALSRVALRLEAADSPAVPLPSTAQRYLEGCVIGALGYLYDPERATRGELFVPLSIEADADQLTMTVRGEASAAKIHQLLPRWVRGASELEGGIPGLRAIEGPKGDGVMLYLVDQPGRVVIRGVAASELEYFRRETR